MRAVGVYILIRLYFTFDRIWRLDCLTLLINMKMWVVPYGLISLFLLIVGIWHLHMPGSSNSIMPSEANNLDDWIYRGGRQTRQIIDTVYAPPELASRPYSGCLEIEKCR